MSNCSDFLLLKEDHTLGNLLSAYLRMAPHVMLAGYKSMFLPLHFPITRSAHTPIQSATPTCPKSSCASRPTAPSRRARPS
jgi:DNA-directed RNA polymerase subunit L